MTYDDYLLENLNYPTSVTEHTTYIDSTNTTQSATLVTPLTGQNVHDNFYNLATKAIDTSARLNTIEALGVTVGSDIKWNGYVNYKGTVETVGSLYSGVPLVIRADVSLPSFPVTFPFPYSFMARVNDGITNTTYTRTFTFPVNTSSFTDKEALVSYLNYYLKNNTLAPTSYKYELIGSQSVEADIYTTYSAVLGTKKFSLYVNDSIVPITCSFTGGSFANPSAFLTVVQASLNNAYQAATGYTLAPFTVSFSSQKLKIVAISDRSTGGIYHFKLTPDAASDGSTASILSNTYFGLVVNGVGEAYDMSSVFTFMTEQVGVTSDYKLCFSGYGSSSIIQLWDGNGSTGKGIFSSIYMGLSTPTSSWGTPYYHSRIPTALEYGAIVPTLNFGGNINANNIDAVTFRADYTLDIPTGIDSGATIPFTIAGKVEDVGGTGSSFVGGAFTAPKAGIYQIDLVVGLDTLISFTNSKWVSLGIDSDEEKVFASYSSSAAYTSSGTTIIAGSTTKRFTLGEVMHLKLLHNLASNPTFVISGAKKTRVTITYLGA